MENIKEINLAEILSALLRRLWLILLAAVVAGAAVYVYTDTVVTERYKSRITLYVCNNSSGNIGDLLNHPSGEESYLNITASDLATSQRLVATYIEMLKSNQVMGEVANKVNEMYNTQRFTAGNIKTMVTAAPLNDTELFEVVVSSTDRQLAKDVADKIGEVAPGIIKKFVKGSETSVVDTAELAYAPYAPNVRTSTTIGMVAGALIAIVAVVLQTLLDVRVKGEEDLANISNAPVLGLIPDLAMETKDHYGYSSGYKYKAYKAYKAYQADPPASAEKEQGGADK